MNVLFYTCYAFGYLQRPSVVVDLINFLQVPKCCICEGGDNFRLLLSVKNHYHKNNISFPKT